jgi:hypothetical protein
LTHRGILGLATDRGSAQAIAPVLAELSRTPGVSVEVVAPPAVHDVFTDFALSPRPVGSGFESVPEEYLDELFNDVQPGLLITGSTPSRGTPPDTLEQFGILEARSRGSGIPSIGILDYWGMYNRRFGFRGVAGDLSLVPDWIYALDVRCRDDLVEMGVPPERIVITHNPWLDRIVRARLPAPHPVLQASGRRVLLVMQPLAPAPPDASRDFWRSVLRAVESNLAALPGALRHRVIVWKHPAQDTSWFDRFTSAGHHNVEVVAVDDRSAGIVAHADMLVTVHSTVAYEAAHYGTPCVSIRAGIADMPPSPMDELGLSTLVRSLDELGSFLRTAEPSLMRANILARKRALLDQGLFFSDGNATARAVHHAHSVLNNLS